MIYLELFWTFIKIGGLTFGGGYAMLPMLQAEIVDKKKWVTEEELLDYYAIAQCTPGVIAVNTATFAGKKVKNNLGGVIATLGVVFPSLVIITIIAAVLSNFMSIPEVNYALSGIRVCVCVLIVNAVIKLLKKSVVDIKTGVIFVAILFASLFTNISPVIFVLLAALAGIVMNVWIGGKQK